MTSKVQFSLVLRSELKLDSSSKDSNWTIKTKLLNNNTILQEIKPNSECQEKERKFLSVNYTTNEALLYEKPVIL